MFKCLHKILHACSHGLRKCDHPQLQTQVPLFDLCKCLQRKSCTKEYVSSDFFVYFNLPLQIKYKFQEILTQPSSHWNSYKLEQNYCLERKRSTSWCSSSFWWQPSRSKVLFLNLFFTKIKNKITNEQDPRRNQFLLNFSFLFIFFLKKTIVFVNIFFLKSKVFLKVANNFSVLILNICHIVRN